MSGVNKVILVGHIGRDPEIKKFPSGAPYAVFSLATSESWRDKATGERREKTEWHNIAVLNEALVKIVEQYLKKGAKVYVEGANRTRKWTDKHSTDHYSTEVVLQGFGCSLQMLDRAERAPAPSEDAYGEQTNGAAPRPPIDDEIPF